MKSLLTETNDKLLDISILLLRCTAGGILFVAGAGKVFGWFGGQGLAMTVQTFATKMGIPAPLAYVSSFTELIGGFLLIVGLFTRLAAVPVVINMVVAFLVTMPGGFIKAAFPFSVMVSAIAILLAGPMGYSLDYLLVKPGDIARKSKSRIFS